MSELNQQESDFSQRLRELPFDDAPRREHGDGLREQVLARFDQARAAGPAARSWSDTFNSWKETMRRPIPRFIAVTAACLAIAAVWLFVPGRQSTALAFNKFAEALVAAKTARFQMEVTTDGQSKQKIQAYYLAPGRMREEMPLMGSVFISDDRTGKLVMLMPATKTVLIMNPQGRPKNGASNDPFKQLRELLSNSRDAKENQYKAIGDKELNGKKVTGFRFDAATAQITLWGDPETGYPVRIETTWSGTPRTEVVMVDFEINVDLKESLFDPTPPADYKVQAFDFDASKPGEQDLVNAFKLCGEISGGEFPDALNIVGQTNFIAKHVQARLKNPSPENVRRVTEQVMPIARGIGFAFMLPASADAHYAGKGVKQGTAGRPIFWYKPEGSTKYRVIDADLSVHTADTPPQVANSERMGSPKK